MRSPGSQGAGGTPLVSALLDRHASLLAGDVADELRGVVHGLVWQARTRSASQLSAAHAS